MEQPSHCTQQGQTSKCSPQSPPLPSVAPRATRRGVSYEEQLNPPGCGHAVSGDERFRRLTTPTVPSPFSHPIPISSVPSVRLLSLQARSSSVPAPSASAASALPSASVASPSSAPELSCARRVASVVLEQNRRDVRCEESSGRVAEWQQCRNRIRYVNNLDKEHNHNKNFRPEKVRYRGTVKCELLTVLLQQISSLKIG